MSGKKPAYPNAMSIYIYAHIHISIDSYCMHMHAYVVGKCTHCLVTWTLHERLQQRLKPPQPQWHMTTAATKMKRKPSSSISSEHIRRQIAMETLPFSSMIPPEFSKRWDFQAPHETSPGQGPRFSGFFRLPVLALSDLLHLRRWFAVPTDRPYCLYSIILGQILPLRSFWVIKPFERIGIFWEQICATRLRCIARRRMMLVHNK